MNTITTTPNRIDALLTLANEIIKTDPREAAALAKEIRLLLKRERLKNNSNGIMRLKSTDEEIFPEMEFFKFCVDRITNNINDEMRPFIRLLKTEFTDKGYIKSIDESGALHAWIAPKELFAAYQKECRKLNTKPNLCLRNIRQTLRRCNFWISNQNEPKSWKRKMKDDTTARTWWLLNMELMTEKDRETFLSLANNN